MQVTLSDARRQRRRGDYDDNDDDDDDDDEATTSNDRHHVVYLHQYPTRLPNSFIAVADSKDSTLDGRSESADSLLSVGF